MDFYVGGTMKRFIIFIVLCVALAANCQVSIGLRLENKYAKSSNPNGNTSDFSLRLGPVVRIPLSGTMEVTPQAGFIYNSTQSTNTGGTSNSSSGLFLGCGLYFYAMSTQSVKLSLGPDFEIDALFKNPTQTTFDLGMPLNFDFDFNRTWCVRVSARVFDFTYTSSGDGTSQSGYSLLSILAPSLTLFYTL